jgi:hypothetical protein
MILLKYSPAMVKRAIYNANSLGSLRESITHGKGNIAGYIGEECISAYLGCDNISTKSGNDKYNHDLVYNGLCVEVKTKRRTVDPKPFYDVSIAITSTHQKPDIYAFTSITVNKNKSGFSNVWLCGFMPYEEYFEKARFYKKGERDSNNGFIVKRDMYNLMIKELYNEISLCS